MIQNELIYEALDISYPIGAVLSRLKFIGIKQNQIKVNIDKNNFKLTFYDPKIENLQKYKILKYFSC